MVDVEGAAAREQPPEHDAKPGRLCLQPTGDRGFESCSLQRRVTCEPVSRGNSPSYVEKPRREGQIMSGTTEQFEGGCLCGAIRFLATGQPKGVAWCHCQSCRKHSGAPVSVFVAFDRTA